MSLSAEPTYPIVCDVLGAGTGQETCLGEIARLRAALDASRAQAEALAEAAADVEAELRLRLASTNAAGQIEPPLTRSTLLSMASLLGDRLAAYRKVPG